MKFLQFAAVLILFGTAPVNAQRVTLVSHKPIMTSSQSAKSTLYLDCHGRNTTVPRWTGSADTFDAISGCEVSIALSSLHSADVFDVVWTANGPCLPTNGSGAGWSGDSGGSITARGTGYSAADETSHFYPTNGAGITHCMAGASDLGPISAGQATIVATVCTDPSAGTVSYILGSPAAGGGAARLCVWNNDWEPVDTEVTDNGPNWTYAGTATVDIENLDNSTNNRVTFVSGLAHHAFTASAGIQCGSSLSYMTAWCGIGFVLDNSGSVSPDRFAGHMSPVSSADVAADGVSWRSASTGVHVYNATVGLHYIQAQDISDGASQSWYRTVGGQREGLSFHFHM